MRDLGEVAGSLGHQGDGMDRPDLAQSRATPRLTSASGGAGDH